ncbi:hypothetical protein AJ78_07762 [Emergomyces pasteurianus Ep9510]|uniref:non-specific serine/threonine protein kinase n=1 Tax=Emergomyces pasteurianus Ep9510 TaxID=1447872 RepID=A0A1J9P6F8_9EURO|nr:hypothetical protein AJ78_07762 [Emergomyces pasteurianus Ep9510]
MAELLQDNCNIIKRYPLNDSLDRRNELLYQAERGDQPRLLSHDGSKNVTGDLARLLTRLHDGDIGYETYGTLVELVLEKASDIDVLKAGLDILIKVSRFIRLATDHATSDGTPWLSNPSQRGDVQKRHIPEARLLDEVKTSTYKNVGGFDAKYFKGNHWEEQFTSIYERVLEHGGGPTDFPDQQFERNVREWWLSFQTNFLAEARGFYYYTPHKSALTGSNAKRQLYLLMKVRADDNSDTTHDWKDVRVVGELKHSVRDRKADLLQMERYVKEVFARQPTRRFIHSFILCGTDMEMWVIDRSGRYSSGAFDIRKEPERFFRAMIGYTLMSDEELGLDTFSVLHDDGTRTVSIEDVHTKEKQLLRLESKPIAVQLGVVCRGTCCFLVKNPDIPGSSNVVKFSWTSSSRRRPEVDLLRLAHEREVEGVAKVIGYSSITSVADLREGLEFEKPYHFYAAATRASLPFNQSQQSKPFRSISESQSLNIAEGSLSDFSRKRKKSIHGGDRPSKRRPRSSSGKLARADHENQELSSMEATREPSRLCPNKRKDAFENRIFRCLVISPAGKALHRFSSTKELLPALRDAIKAHRSLYLKGNILHRDISENNIIITDSETANGYSGMLIDLDLAEELGDGPTGAWYRTGTMQFMAIEVLLNMDHTYRHDLESFFYVLIWQCARNGWECYNRSIERPVESRLKKWYTGSYDDIADVKEDHIGAKTFEYLLLEFPPELECVKPLCRQLRRILFPIVEDDIFTGTPVNSEKLYGPIIQAFDEAIEEIRNAKE